MKLNELNFLTLACWNQKHQPLTIDTTKDKNTGCYLLGLNSLFLLDSSPFSKKKQLSFYSIVTEQNLINLGKLAEEQEN